MGASWPGRSTPTAWGWHRLGDAFAEQLVATSAVCPGDLVLDIGAGDGALVGPLLRRGVTVIAVERHPARLAELRRRFADAGRRLVIVDADASDLRLPRRPFHVVANPPFGVTSALLRRLLQPGSRLVTAHLILQQQVVTHWAGPAAPGASRWRRDFEVVAATRLPRAAFRPPPRTDCAVLAVRRRSAPRARGRYAELRGRDG